jgi:hypothetical protein
VVSEKLGCQEKAYEKVSYLLARGADPTIKGRFQPFFTPHVMEKISITPYDLSRVWLGSDMTLRLNAELTRLGYTGLSFDRDNEEYHDALEEQPDL